MVGNNFDPGGWALIPMEAKVFGDCHASLERRSPLCGHVSQARYRRAAICKS